MLVHDVLMSRKFDDFEQLLPIRKRNAVLVPVQNQEFYRPTNHPSTSYDYEYDYDLVDRAPGYDVYRSREADGRHQDSGPKYRTNCSEVSETQFVTEYKESCSIVYEKSCKREYIQSYNKKKFGTEVNGKCVLKYETKCSVHERTHNKGKDIFLATYGLDILQSTVNPKTRQSVRQVM